MSAIFGSAYVSGLDTTQHHPSSIFATPGAETVVETDRYEVRFLRNQVTVMKQSAVKYPHLANATVERLVKTINITPRDDEKTYATYLPKTRLHTCWNVLINGAECGDAGKLPFVVTVSHCLDNLHIWPHQIAKEEYRACLIMKWHFLLFPLHSSIFHASLHELASTWRTALPDDMLERDAHIAVGRQVVGWLDTLIADLKAIYCSNVEWADKIAHVVFFTLREFQPTGDGEAWKCEGFHADGRVAMVRCGIMHACHQLLGYTIEKRKVEEWQKEPKY